MAVPDLKTVKKTRVGDGTPGPGRPKGLQNKTTTLLKDAILQAAENAGGKAGLIGYLQKQAGENPSAFMPLLGKVLPMQLTGDGGGPRVRGQRELREALGPEVLMHFSVQARVAVTDKVRELAATVGVSNDA